MCCVVARAGSCDEDEVGFSLAGSRYDIESRIRDESGNEIVCWIVKGGFLFGSKTGVD